MLLRASAHRGGARRGPGSRLPRTFDPWLRRGDQPGGRLAGLAAVVVLLARQVYRHWGWHLMDE
ncbi:hypothetical protein [Modestobacter sp. VKM Ac-2984]|uniref:hypothetical protein n=1 Tax=Modestobacter sp. VKM Ac-2984 TaxID=3004138 RepID=UPI0022AA2412|nr:hypothetical protein [Modestobacter sp. VKM Ac-2984]MCZ2816113.1 hypothetical protein [Modestobacter sp. VKM Ac-2984]